MSPTSIPTHQTAACIDNPSPGATLTIRHDIPVPVPGAGEVLVKLEYTGFCHSDLHNINGDLLMTTNVPGHEGVGRVVRVGPDTPAEMVGRRVGVKWLYKTCMKCPTCKVQYTNCRNQDNSGRNVPGTFQQYVVSPANFVSLIPEDLNPEAVAPLLCAGLTMYGALSKVEKLYEKGDWVVIMGAGGGLGHLGLQIGKEMGYKMIAVDSPSKKDLCLASGASAFFDFKDDNLIRNIQSLTDGVGAHAALIVVGSEKAYEQGVALLRPLGTLVCVGFPRPDFHVPVAPHYCVDYGLQILGSAVGTETEMQALLEMARAGKVSTHYEVFDLEQINDVVARMRGYAVSGRAVLRIPEAAAARM
ncbi:alcohol dehydrogenase [Aspergillus costaricaensis CBS 115574]|uniref:Alcohol dehydrogenase n=1 Tax=Aspergillus costaricaensis CBS 115574 TaxID=1448317 RepID=A0ACD1I5N3_9EURO|nr:alcohol dehydrogenase [Aspergillus costaricaensis CBS 115574]RAK85587.1 alcohol dehydrogenase [Aspergillus costaricaensis CBS 115574]